MTRAKTAAASAAMLMWLGCGSSPAPAPAVKSEAPAKVAGPALKEAELSSVTLTPQAETRTGIRVVPLAGGKGGEIRRFAGEVVLPPGRTVLVAAPVSGTLSSRAPPPATGAMVRRDQVLFEVSPLLPFPRDLRVTAEADVEQARTRLEGAEVRLARAERLLKDEVGTARAVDDARNEVDLAKAALQAARTRLDQVKRAPLEGDATVAVRAPRDGMARQVLAGAGQAVSAGAPLLEIVDLHGLWLRVPVYAGESTLIAPGRAVRVESLSGAPLGEARPVDAPPSGDSLASTVDFYYETPSSRHDWKPGERVTVAIQTGTPSGRLSVPQSALVYDINGGTWLYEQAPNHRYVRRRVQVDHAVGGLALLASGPPVGTLVVVEGAAELWGVEFGAGK